VLNQMPNPDEELGLMQPLAGWREPRMEGQLVRAQWDGLQ